MSAVRALCTIRISTVDEGGLRQPLALPTRSLVFRLTDGPEAGAGLDGLIAAGDSEESLVAGSVLTTNVTFPIARVGVDVRQGQRFLLWMGRVVGEAVVDQIVESDRT